MILRHGLKVRGLDFRLYYPKPRSAESAAAKKHGENRITFRPHFYFGETNQEIDFVFFLNGLPIVALEVKHEKNQNVHDAVAQFAARDHARKIFRHPFLYLAADTSDAMAASSSSRVENFRWHNSGLTNTPQTAGDNRSSSCIAKCCQRTTCSKRCRSSWSGYPSAIPRRTGRSSWPSPSYRATTRAEWCARWPTMPCRTSRRPATSGAST